MGKYMKYSKVFYRLGFFSLALIYLAVIAEFIAPNSFNISLDVRFDAVFFTIAVVGFLYFFLRGNKMR